jgi:hypothetical protein
MARRPADPIESAMEMALAPGRFISEGASYSFVRGLEEVAQQIGGITEASPDRGVALYETFIAGCYEKAEEVDDSSGSLGAFGGGLFCGWVTARQAAAADAADTVARLLAWMDNDQYGFCFGIEEDIASALDDTGRAACVAQIGRLLDPEAQQNHENARLGPAYAQRRLEGMLRALYAAQRDADAYITLAEQSGLSARDCHAVATILAAKEMTAEALGWAGRGIEMDRADSGGTSAAFDLRELRRDLLVKLGRNEEALQSTWADFGRNPSSYAYDDLMKLVPVKDRASWHEKAIEAAAQPGRCPLPSLIPLLVETKEIKRLAELVGQCTADQLEQTSHYTLEPAAKTLDEAYPGPAARLWCAMALRIVDAGKSKYYRAALDNFQRARRSFCAAGLQVNWEEIVDRVRASHSRKTGFMRGFEEIVAGSEPEPAPAFLEKAKARWAPPPSRQV